MKPFAPTGPVLLVDVASPNGNVARLTRAVEAALRARGRAVERFDAGDPRAGARIVTRLAESPRPALCFSFYGVTDGLNLEGRSPFEAAGVRHHAYHLDHPFHNLYRLVARPWQGSCHSRSLAGAEQARLADDEVAPGHRHWVLPHATAAVAGDGGPASRRDLDLVFIGAYDDPDRRLDSWRQTFAGRPALIEALRHLAERAAAAEAGFRLDRACLDLAADLDPGERLHNAAALFQEADRLARAEVRTRAIAALSPLGIHLFGPGWERAAGHPRFAGAVIHGPVAGDRVPEVLGRARITVNPLPAYYESHERPLDALAAGALPVAFRTPFLRDSFRQDEEIALVAPLPAEMAARAADLLAMPGVVADMAAAGRRACLAGHTWGHRLDALFARLAEEGR